MKVHGMNRKRNKEFFNPILSNLSGHIAGCYKDIELYENEPIIILKSSTGRIRRNIAFNSSKCQK